MKSVLVAILTWNNGEELLRCIRSLEAYMNQYDFLLVDNASTDRSVELARRAFPNLQAIHNSSNLGAAGGYNTCLTYARSNHYEYILLIDGDMTLTSGNLIEFEIFLKSNPLVSAVCPKIVFPDGGLLWSAGGRLNPYIVQSAAVGHKQKNGEKFNRPYDADFSPNPWMIKLPTTPKKLMFSTEYGRYGFEDVDFFFRLRKNGGALRYLPTVVFAQNPKSSPTRNSCHYYYLITRNRILFAKKNLSKLTFAFIFIPYFVIRKFLLEGLFFLLTGQFKAALNIWRGICWHCTPNETKTKLDRMAQ